MPVDQLTILRWIQPNRVKFQQKVTTPGEGKKGREGGERWGQAEGGKKI